ncbi:MAG TPA: hypothetical protein VFN50_01350 [Acidimicrobiales bacterium]|nr:hypothetical protein [Acidimicrobiales bacterium]
MAPLLLDDDGVTARLAPRRAVAAMRTAVLAVERGEIESPPRAAVQFASGRLVFTCGARTGRWYGYRSYDSFETDPGEEVVVLHDWSSGRVRAVATGRALGPLRTGAIGGLAVDLLARPDAQHLGLVGSGRQAWTQLWAANAVRRLESVTVYSRSAERRRRFVQRAERELGLVVRDAPSAKEAVSGCDLVVLATSSGAPVIDPAWVGEGCHVTTLGPKQAGRAEFDHLLAERADVVATDSIAQARSYDPPFVLAGTAQMDRLVSLSALAAGAVPGRTADSQVTLFCSVGLAGTEVLLLSEILDQLEDGAGSPPAG